MHEPTGRALVVDDERAIREYCQAVLAKLGYRVELAEDGAVALQRFRSGATYDLMLIDLSMPQIGGRDVLAYLDEAGGVGASIVMTGYGTFENAAELVSLGAQGLLSKPFTLAELRALVRKVQLRQHNRPLPPPTDLLDLASFQALCQRLAEIATATCGFHGGVLVMGGTAETLQQVEAAGQPIGTASDYAGLVRQAQQQHQQVFQRAELGLATVCVLLQRQEKLIGAFIFEQTGAHPLQPGHAEQLRLAGQLASVAAEGLVSQPSGHHLCFSAMFTGVNEPMALVNVSKNQIVDANNALLGLSGYTHSEICALPLPIIFPNMLTTDSSEPFELVLQTRDGQERVLLASRSHINHNGYTCVLVIARDTTAHTRAMLATSQAERLASMNRLSASLAHEINNPLQALQSSLHLLVERQMPDERRQQISQMAYSQAGQLATIVQQMMDLYRPAQRKAMRLLSPHELLETVLASFVTRLQDQGIELRREWHTSLPRVRAVGSQLRQVFASLIANAVEAMPEGGTLRVSTDVVEQDGERWVQIRFTDTGSGIATKVLPNIFEPFFSTSTSRTGLGLAVSYSIIEQHEGRLLAESNRHGTVFTVLLPAIETVMTPKR